MRRRRLLLGAGALALLGLVAWVTLPPPGVTWKNFRRLRHGMGDADVEAILGKPRVTEGPYEAAGGYRKFWAGETGGPYIALSFSGDGYLRRGYAIDRPANPAVYEPLWESRDLLRDRLLRLRRLLPW